MPEGARRAVLGGVTVGDGCEVAVVGVLNASPESFYAGSVHADPDDLLRAAERMAAAGAALVDIGGMSTAPYLRTRVSEAEEADRLAEAVRRVAEKVGIPVSVDTARAGPARAALEAGAVVVNDVTGLRGDPEMAGLVASRGAGLIAMAWPGAGAAAREPVAVVRAALEKSLAIARRAGIPDEHVVLDPGIGFFREGTVPWHERDAAVLAGLGRLRGLGRPLCLGVSRKSFIGVLTGREEPAGRLAGSLAATAVAVVNGAALIRTHDVAETRDAVRVAAALRR